MPTSRSAIFTLLGFRILYGLVLLVAPARGTKNWLGEGAAEAAPTQVALRGLGAREVALHGAAIAAIASGQPARPWLAASFVGDLSDVVSTTISRDGLPSNAAPVTAAVAGVFAGLTVVAAATVDE